MAFSHMIDLVVSRSSPKPSLPISKSLSSSISTAPIAFCDTIVLRQTRKSSREVGFELLRYTWVSRVLLSLTQATHNLNSSPHASWLSFLIVFVRLLSLPTLTFTKTLKALLVPDKCSARTTVNWLASMAILRQYALTSYVVDALLNWLDQLRRWHSVVIKEIYPSIRLDGCSAGLIYARQDCIVVVLCYFVGPCTGKRVSQAHSKRQAATPTAKQSQTRGKVP